MLAASVLPAEHNNFYNKLCNAFTDSKILFQN